MVKVREKIAKQKENILHIIFMLIIFLLGTYKLLDIGHITIYDDEYGYWAGSAYLMGQDWSSITSKIPYYSYGYGILLIPIRLLSGLLDWNWRTLFQSAVVMNCVMLVIGYRIAVTLCKRYFSHLHWLVRDMACFVVMIYPSFIIYSHMTLSEAVLAFFFWVFLYTMMKVIEKPSYLNHVCFGLVAFYMYVVHQRCIAFVIAAVMMIIYIKLQRINKLGHVTVFLGTMFCFSLVHKAIKKGLQNDFYLAKEPLGLTEMLSHVFSKTTLIFFLAVLACILLLYMIEKGKIKLSLAIVAVAIAGGIAFLILKMDSLMNAAAQVDGRLATNDFAGQIGRIKAIFTGDGFLRLLISMSGKWFYLASATGLVICWGIKDLILNAITLAGDGIRGIVSAVKGQPYESKVSEEEKNKKIWLLGVFLGWIGIFMVASIFMNGFARVDNIIYGRYHETAAGIVILYGFISLLKDKEWFSNLITFAFIYIGIGRVCQYLFDEIQCKWFELAHSVMIGRVFVNNSVPTGKVWELASYVLPFGIVFILIVKLAINKFSKIIIARYIIALCLTAGVWTYISVATVHTYVIPVNAKHAVSSPTIAMWLDRLASDEDKVYCLSDTIRYRWCESLQFVLNEYDLILTTSGKMNPDEDAFYIMSTSSSRKEKIQEKFVTVIETSNFALLVPREQKLHQRMRKYKYMY